MAKIIVRIFGGLGNQLFGYAAARRLALVNNAELVIDDVTGFVRDYQYQRRYLLDHFNIPVRKAIPAERLEPFNRYRRGVLKWWSSKMPFVERRYLVQEGRDFDARLLTVKVKGSLYLEGYWQSEDYFKDVESTIRNDLKIKPPTDQENQEMAARIRDCLSVAVHVRFFDAPDTSSVNNAPRDYYTRAIERMEAIAPQAHYYVFSDRPEIARARIPLPDSRVTCVSHNKADESAYADLWLMRQCQHFIIANSTFSWWGAWLAEYAGKEILAPSGLTVSPKKITAWGFRGLIPQIWQTL